MKKLLNISVVAMLAISPFVANAAVTDADPGATVEENAAVAEYAPKYGLAQAGDHDSNVVTAGYVKGAYNAAIKAINKVSETADNAANKDLSNLSATGKANIAAQGTYNSSTNYNDNTVGAAIKALESSSVTEAGVLATINDATASVTGVSLTVAGTPTGSVSSSLSNATMSGTVDMPTSGTVDTLTVWGNDNSTSTATVTLATTSTNISGNVTGTVNSTFTGSGIDSGTATGNITGIGVSVASFNPGI